MSTADRAVRLAAASLFAAACGGGGGGGSASIGGPTVVTTTFPPARFLTNDPTLTVRGDATNPARLASIEVGGSAATTSDSFATWGATVGLGDATTDVEILPVEHDGTRLLAPGVTAEFERLPGSIEGLAADPNRRQLLVAESGQPAGLVALDVASGRWIEVSGPDRGAGEEITGFETVGVDAANDRAFGSLSSPSRIFAIDLATGDRSVLSDESGGNLALQGPREIVADDAHGRVLVVDVALRAIVAVRTSDGVRSLFSDATHGTGPAFQLPSAAHLLAAKGRLLVVDQGADALLSVDLATGDRTVVADATHGSGGSFLTLRGVALDDRTGDALLVDSTLDVIYRVNLVTGDRSVVSGPGVGAGEAFRAVFQIVSFEDGRGSVFVGDVLLGSLLAVDVASGDRSVAESVRIGGASPLGRMTVLDTDRSTGHVFAMGFASSSEPALLEIDPRSGAHAVVSSSARGSGPTFVRVSSVAAVPSRDAVLVVDVGVLLSVDRVSGDRTVVADSQTGSGAPFTSPAAVAVDDAQGIAYVAATDASGPELLRIDLATGVRTVVSSALQGGGPAFDCPLDLALTADASAAFVVSRCDDALYRVDLATGDRTLVSGDGFGSGPVLAHPARGLALDVDGRHAFVADLDAGILRIDLASGERALVSGDSLGHGPFAALELRPSADGAHLFAFRFGAGLVEIDPATGDRAIVSY